MILYSLACEQGHRFESWFRDSTAYDDQSSRNLVSCPACHSTRVAKTIMAPAVVGARKPNAANDTKPNDTKPNDTARNDTGALPPTDRSGAAPSNAPMDVALIDPQRRELAALLKSVRDKVIAEGHDVGVRFPEEARRIHDGEAPARQIYGQASIAEARDLLDDGILVLPLPRSPDEFN